MTDNNTLSVISSVGGLAAAGAGGMSIPTPFAKEILLLDGIHVAGTTHVEGIEAIAEGVKPGDRLNFVRQPDNPYDEHCIRVFLTDGRRIGFVPADQNLILSRLMDAGKEVFGKIESVEKRNHWYRIGMEVYLND